MKFIAVKLFRFSLPDVEVCPVSGERAVLYLFSLRSDEEYLRKMFEDQDPGDMPPDLYERLYKEGSIERITSIEQVPLPTEAVSPLYAKGERDWCPYTCWDLQSFELTIEQFLNPPDHYRDDTKTLTATCGFEGCEEEQTLTIRLETKDGVDFDSFCHRHLLLAAEFIRKIAENEGGQDDSFLLLN